MTTIDHSAAARAARSTTRDHAILHAADATAAAKFAALERSQKDADSRAVLVAGAYLEVLEMLPTLRREHTNACSTHSEHSVCTCGADALNARIDAVLGQ